MVMSAVTVWLYGFPLYTSDSTFQLLFPSSFTAPPYWRPYRGCRLSFSPFPIDGRAIFPRPVFGQLPFRSASPCQDLVDCDLWNGHAYPPFYQQDLSYQAPPPSPLYTAGVLFFAPSVAFSGMDEFEQLEPFSPEFSPLFPCDNSLQAGFRLAPPSGSPRTGTKGMTNIPSGDSLSDAVSVMGPPFSVKFNLDSPFGIQQFTPLRFSPPESYFCNVSNTFYPSLTAQANNRTRLDMAVIIHVLSSTTPMDFITSSLRRQWYSFGPLDIIPFERRSLLGLFASSQARDAVLQRSPWFVNDRLVGLDRWSPSFTGIYSILWLRLPSLPFQLWDKKHIAMFASVIGEPLWLDNSTLDWGTASFARVAVRVEIIRPLRTGIWVEGPFGRFYQHFMLEGLSVFCPHCLSVDHPPTSCLNAPLDPDCTHCGGDFVPFGTS
ncbi:hypothetical protein M5K25_009031 [Dendrobium thyrsiflorum]|uniref:DUF4283 domain-containing protein n=1 Tax=Dendrobium thyrsiflorum TaxID=117978 RepID=A0ABD0V590_DENTH